MVSTTEIIAADIIPKGPVNLFCATYQNSDTNGRKACAFFESLTLYPEAPKEYYYLPESR